MTKEQFERDRVSIAIAKAMLSRKIITKKDYIRIHSMLIGKYKPVVGGL